MDKETRRVLSLPFGPVLSPKKAVKSLEDTKPKLIIAVGDKTIFNLLERDITPHIAVFDELIMRKKASKKIVEKINSRKNETKKIKNPAGGITPELISAIKSAIKSNNGWIFVEGEEDLATLPALVYAPIGTVILYGQPKKGMVYLQVDDEKKEIAKNLLKKIKE